MNEPLRIAMWSGPRNISTAMMRAWENRGDCTVADEPLYAHYLAVSGAPHPLREAVIAAGETDWDRATAALTGAVPDGRPIWYQKHMTHHLPAGCRRDWIGRLRNVFLIRDPAAVVASYLRARDEVSADAIGVPQQASLFDEEAERLGAAPPVIDADAFLRAPEAHLRALCAVLSIRFTTTMLRWPAGPRASDGVWAPHWYAAVWRSTGFEPPSAPVATPTGSAARVVESCRPHYERLLAHRLRV